MKRAIPMLFLLSAALLTTAAQEPKKEPAGKDHDFSDTERWVSTFEPPDRYEWQNPEGVLYMTMVDVGHRVADLGAGTGYFTRMLSESVRKEVEKRLRLFEKGGLILGPSHDIQVHTPVDNVVAMYQAAGYLNDA